MTPTIAVIRSIGAEFARRLFLPIAIITAIICILLVTGVLLLATLSRWWFLLLIPEMIVISVVFGVLMISWLVIRTVRPLQTKTQHRAIKAYVDTLQRISDNVQTPKIILFFRVLRDIAAPRKDGFIGSMSDDTASLKRDFHTLQQLF